MRKLSIFILLIALFISPVIAADGTYPAQERQMEILAYRVGGEADGPYFYFIDALSDSLLNQSASTEPDITGYMDRVLGDLNSSDPSSTLASFRVEGKGTGSFYVAVAVTDFYQVENGNPVSEGTTIKGEYRFDHMDIRFNDTHEETDGSGKLYISTKDYDGKDSSDLSKGVRKTLGGGTTTAEGLSAIIEVTPTLSDSSISENEGYLSARWTVSSKDGTATDVASDYWICRGAVLLLIDETGYEDAVGTFRTNVIVEWGTIE